MKRYLEVDEWKIIEKGFHPEYNRNSESIFSLGNGRFGQRGNFEEKYSGDSLQGSYVAGIYYPDKTKVGWWKNGYPEYYAKVLNTPYWNGISVQIDNEELDLNKCEILDFERILNMKEGYLERNFTVQLSEGKKIKVHTQRFISLVHQEICAIQYSIIPLNFDAKINFSAYLKGDVKNEDANDNEYFWETIQSHCNCTDSFITSETKKTKFKLCLAMSCEAQNPEMGENKCCREFKNEVIQNIQYNAKRGEEARLFKYVSVISSRYTDANEVENEALRKVNNARILGYFSLLEEHIAAWQEKWKFADIAIEGNPKAQQAVRFNIFQLLQTYTGDDATLNIGPKGFTGEKYGGSTYWDTEAFCLPFYMTTMPPNIAKNLLLYRYNQLPKAIENAEKLGFKNGAALFPMVTINGEECHNEWEITFEEIHRNGAIAYAIKQYVDYVGDLRYLAKYGAEVLIAISRFWRQRVNFSEEKQKFVMLGVTGPNEYENNVNNNWYTNKIAQWCFEYTIWVIDMLKEYFKDEYKHLIEKTNFCDKNEVQAWKQIAENMYFPHDRNRNIFLQQDGFLDKELTTISELPTSEIPLCQNWSWDRILRSCFIKQADILQGIYFFEEGFSKNEIKNHFDFYEPMTVHESSLSPCVHSIIATKIGYLEKAHDLFIRSSRLDLDDYNNDTKDGCHISSMAGSWLSIVHGFAGMKINKGAIEFNPVIPPHWNSYSFRFLFRGENMQIDVDKIGYKISKVED